MFKYRARKQFAFLFMFAATSLSLLLSAPVPASAQPTGYQEYYVLGYEEHVWRAFLAINDGDDSGIKASNICSTVSLVATADHQVVYYDHWEDGYETDLLNPTQDTTRIYGDGDVSNGGSGSDTLLAGADVNLTSDQGVGGPNVITATVPVSPTRNSSYIRYDGGDRVITSGGPVDLTHAMWPDGASWVGGAWETYSRQAYAGAYFYHLPIGEDLYNFGGGDNGAYGDFRNVYLQLGAFENNTTVSIDNGVDMVNLTLDRGQTYSSMGHINSTSVPSITINAGATIRSNKSIQVGLLTGADGGFQGRFLTVLPDQQWGADYIVPVPRGYGRDDDDGYQDAPAEIYLFNPNDFPVEIQAYDAITQTSFVISSTDNVSATIPYSQLRGSYVPQDSAARFTSADGVFGVVVCADTSRIDYDWGFSGIPAKYLTNDYYIPWAPGSTDLSGNGSPVWVTPLVNDTTFHVDYSPLDDYVDETFTLDVLAQRRITDTDKDNTGMHVWAADEFAVAWGEDPRTAGKSNPYLDLGLSVLPLQQRWLDPVLTLDKTAEPTILPRAGGTVTFTLAAQAYSASLVNVDITDTLPISWTYVPSSALVVYENGSSESLEPAINDRTLFWDTSTDLDRDQGLTLTFQAQITNTAGVSVSLNQSEAIGKHKYSNSLFNPTDDAAIHFSSLNLVKSVNDTSAQIGDTLVYTITYFSDSITATNVVLRDIVPVQHVTFQSASDGGSYEPAGSTVTWTLGALAPGESGDVVFTVTVNSFAEEGAVIENVGRINSDQTAEAASNEVRTTVLAPDVKFSKSGPTVARRGDTITYTLSYENAGGAAATGVTIQDTIPLSTTYITSSLAIITDTTWFTLTDAADGDQGAYISPTLIITPGTIPAGESGQIRFSVQLDSNLAQGARIMNSAILDRNLDIPRESNLMVTRVSNLLISKQAEQTVTAPGSVISYTLTYENVSDSITQTDVYVREPIPDYTSFISGTAYGDAEIAYSWDNGATWSATLPITPVTHIRWYDAVVPTTTQATVDFAVRVNDDLPEGITIANEATITSTESGMSYSDPVDVPTVDLLISKMANAPAASPGQPVTYTITCGNDGSAPASGAVISDRIPANTTLIPGSITAGGVAVGQTITWSVDLPAQTLASPVSFAVTVTDSLPAGVNIITNTATCSSERGFSAAAAITTTAVAAPDLVAAKSDGVAFISPGALLTYTLVYSNVGTQEAAGVVVTDVLPDYTSFITASRSASETTPGLVVWPAFDLSAGDNATATLTVAVNTPLPTDVNAITNTVTITDDGANGGDLNPIDNTAAVTTAIYRPAFTLTKQADSRWTRRVKLTFNNISQTEDLVDFPVLVVLSDTINVDYSQTQDAGQDIRFIDADGVTLLAHEIEEWNEDGASYVWVRVPQIDGSSNTDHIWMYYGNPAAPDGQDPPNVWAEDYRIVYHLDAPSPTGVISDSTSNRFDGTNEGSTDGMGFIAQGQTFDGSDYVNLGTDLAVINGVSAATLSAWVKLDDVSSNNGDILGVSIYNGGASTGSSRASIVQRDAEVGIYARSLDDDSDFHSNETTTDPLVQDTWHHVVAVIDYANDAITICVDGVPQAINGAVNFSSTTTPDTNSANSALGSNDDGGSSFLDGVIDEARLAATVRSSDWITAQYQSMTGNFVIFGGEEKIGDLTAAGIAGIPFTYTISITNTGLAQATDVVVTETLPGEAHYVSSNGMLVSGDRVSWTVPSISPNDSERAVFVVSACQTSLVNASYRVVSSTQGVNGPYGPEILTLLTPPTVEAQFSHATVGRTVYFTATGMTNGSPIVAQGWDFGDANTGNGLTVTHTYTDTGAYTVTLTVTDACNYTDTVVDTVFPYAPILTFTKSAEPSVVRAGETLTYTILVSNTDSGPVAGVVVTDAIPNNAVFVTATSPHTGPVDGVVVWPLGTLSSGVTSNITMVVRVDSAALDGAVITNTAWVSAGLAFTSSDMVTTEVETAADLAIGKTGVPGSVVARETLTYTLVYTNRGPSDARRLYITDTLPLSVTYGGMLNSPLSGPTQAGRSLTWYTPTLAAGAQDSIVFTVTVDADAVDALDNQAVIASDTYDPQSGNNEANQTTLMEKLVVIKTAVDPDGAPLYPGDEIEYQVLVTNPSVYYGHYNITLSDPVPTYTTLIEESVGCSPGVACGDSDGLVTAAADSLGPGEVLTLTFHAAVHADAAGYTITNQATAGSDQQIESTQSLPTFNKVTAFPDLTLNKWADPGSSRWADTWTQYHFQVANTGGVTLTDVQIWDDQLGPEIGPFSVPDLAAGESYLVTRWWPVNGDTYNVATATAQAPDFPDLLSASDNAYFDFVEGLTITLDVSAQPETIPAGQIVSYTYRLVNTGDDWMEGGLITDTVYGDITSGLSLAPGTSYTRILTHQILITTANVAYARGVDRLGNPVTATDAVTVVVGAPEDCVLYLPLIVRNH